MEDWHKIRKSDEEFIHEIYELSRLYEQQTIKQEVDYLEPILGLENKKRVVQRLVKNLSIAAMVGLVLLGAVKSLPRLIQNQSPETIDLEKYRSVEENELTSSTHEENVKEDTTAIKVVGVVENLQVTGSKILLTIVVNETPTDGNEEKLSVSISKDFYNQLLEYEKVGTKLLSKKVLLYVERQTGQSEYKLRSEDDFYLWNMREDGTEFYQNLSGCAVSDENEG